MLLPYKSLIFAVVMKIKISLKASSTNQNLDIDECQGSPCDTNGKCSNSPGSFVCECKIGYAGDGFICTGTFHDI